MNSIKFAATLALACSAVIGATATAFSLTDLIKQAHETADGALYSATGSLRICAANEVKAWITDPNGVLEKFKASAQSVSVRESDLIFTGSQELADDLNNGNANRCDLVIFGSDVAALRASAFEKAKSTSLAYSPIIYVGQKSKLNAARNFLGKQPTDSLSCLDLAKVGQQRFLGRIDKSASNKVAKLTVEMSTSNSGQAGYFSCVYSTLMATTASDVEQALATPDGAKSEKDIQDFMQNITFLKDKSSGAVISDFIGGGGTQIPGAAHLAVITYEMYLPKIQDAAKTANVEMEWMYPDVGVLNNFPAIIVANPTSNQAKAAKAFLQVAMSKQSQSTLPKYGLHPAIPGIPLADYMKADVGAGDAPTSRANLRKVWDVVGQNANVQASGILNFPNF
jgi:hypothetical protein